MELVSGNPLRGDKFTTELTNHSTVGEEKQKEKIFAIWWSRKSKYKMAKKNPGFKLLEESEAKK